MGNSEFDDLDDLDGDVEVVQLRTKRPKADDMSQTDVILLGMAETQKAMASFQMDMERQRQKDERQRQKDARDLTRVLRESSDLQVDIHQRIANQVDDRFDQMAKAQQSLVPVSLTPLEKFLDVGTQALRAYVGMLMKNLDGEVEQ